MGEWGGITLLCITLSLAGLDVCGGDLSAPWVKLVSLMLLSYMSEHASSMERWQWTKELQSSGAEIVPESQLTAHSPPHSVGLNPLLSRVTHFHSAFAEVGVRFCRLVYSVAKASF